VRAAVVIAQLAVAAVSRSLVTAVVPGDGERAGADQRERERRCRDRQQTAEVRHVTLL